MASINWKLIFIVSLGLYLRYSVRFSSYYTEISKRVEVSSPVNSWIRVIEGVALRKSNISPYNGDTFHESPIFLQFYEIIVNYFGEFQIGILFILLDIITAFILSNVAIKQLNRIKENDKLRLKDNYEKFCENNLDRNAIQNSAEWIIAIYMLSPYSILACVGQSTSILNNFLISFILLTATNGYRFISLFLLSLSCLNTFYSLILLPSVILILEQKIPDKSKSDLSQPAPKKSSIIYSLIIFCSLIIYLLVFSFWIESFSFEFINSTYIFTWTVSDLTPNIGIFWYFFAEIFDHFRNFFLWVFQINFFLYIIPLTLKLWENPYFLCIISLMNHSIFKPYPTVADIGLYLSLLPQWSHLFGYMKSTLVVSGTIVTTSVLAPILWYLWIVLGTANSNFYFGITLAFNVAQIFLMTDLIFAYIKREFHVKNIDLYMLCKKIGESPRIELSHK